MLPAFGKEPKYNIFSGASMGWHDAGTCCDNPSHYMIPKCSYQMLKTGINTHFRVPMGAFTWHVLVIARSWTGSVQCIKGQVS